MEEVHYGGEGPHWSVEEEYFTGVKEFLMKITLVRPIDHAGF